MYSIEDYDNKGVLKPGGFLTLCTAYVARFLLFGPISLIAGRAMRGREALDVSFLTEVSPFEMLSSIPAVLVLFIMLRRNVNSPSWMRTTWQYSGNLLGLSVLVQISLQAMRVYNNNDLPITEFLIGMTNMYLVFYFFFSARPKAVFSMFPEKTTSTS